MFDIATLNYDLGDDFALLLVPQNHFVKVRSVNAEENLAVGVVKAKGKLSIDSVE